MADLCMAFDPSSSVSKVFYSPTHKFEPKLLTMEPDVIEIPQSGIKQYLSGRLGNPSPIHSSWIEYKNSCYAIGTLARQQFHSQIGLKLVKSHQILYKLLALVGVIADRERLPTAFNLELGILLPYGEYQDRQYLEKTIAKALKSFRFRDREFKVHLQQFDCIPEGGGLLMRGIEPGFSKNNVLVIMIGYRNASYLLTRNKQFQTGETTDLGMIRMLEMVQKSVSGLTPREIIVPISQAGYEVKKQPLTLLMAERQLLQTDMELVKAIKAAQKQYWSILKHWLKGAVFGSVDLVLFSGGTAWYYKDQLETWFKTIAHKQTWAQKLELEIEELVGEEIHQWHYRLTDVYAYFYWLQYIRSQKRKVS